MLSAPTDSVAAQWNGPLVVSNNQLKKATDWVKAVADVGAQRSGVYGFNAQPNRYNLPAAIVL